MLVYPNVPARTLADPHQKMLYSDSSIGPDVAEERGAFTAWKGEDVPQAHGWLPGKPGLVFPVHTLDGEVFHRLRPDNPGNFPKYMQPKGCANRLDVHPRQHERIKQPGGMRFITEGERKVDAGVSRDLLMIGVSGVYNGQKGGELIPDWLLLPLVGEKYSIVYDSDILTNPNVQMAADRQARLLRDAGAEVSITFLPDGPDGRKLGLDDFFAAGGTVGELELLTRPYDAADFARVRMSKDKKLRAAVEQLWREWWSFDWTRFHGTAEKPHRMRGHTARDIAMVQIEAIARHGKVKGDEVHVSLSQRTIAERAATRQATVNKGLKHLAAAGWCEYRPGESRDKLGFYVLRASAYQVERESTGERNVVEETVGDTHLRGNAKGPLEVPRLRWSGPSFHREDGEIVRDYIHRQGKDIGALYDRLEQRGDMTVEEAAAAMNMRTRDFLARKLPKMEDAEIVECEAGVIRLARNWRAALDFERELKGEYAVAEKQKADHKRQRDGFRNRDKPPISKPSGAGLEAVRRSREKSREHRRENLVGWEEDKTPEPLSPLALAVRDYLARCPRDARQPAGWLGATLWALELFDGKPTPAETRSALEELGGAAFLDGRLKRAKETAA
jgi:hypothetical protein